MKKEPSNKTMDFLRDCGALLLEATFLLIMVLSPWLFKVQMQFDTVSEPVEIVWSWVSTAGKMPFCFALFAFWLLAIRKYNENAVLNSTSTYHDYPFFFYMLAGFLGYKKCILVGTPIHLQIRVVMHQLFESYPTQQELETEKDTSVNVNMKNEYSSKMKVNLLVADTYDISMEQLPTDCRNLYTIIIEQTAGFGVHVCRPKLIEKVSEIVSKLPDGCELNYFATTNPRNQEQITRQVFMKFGRGNIGIFNVYQQDLKDPRMFERKVTIKG